MQMTRKIGLTLCALLVATVCAIAGNAIVAAETIRVSGGTSSVAFDNADCFDLYTSSNLFMYTYKNRLYAPVFGETKAIYKNGIYGDAEVSADITPINKSGRLNGGIYVQASNASNAVDGITAWNVNVEHEMNAKTFSVFLHRFENNRWAGVKKEARYIRYSYDTVHLRVVVKAGTLQAYVGGELAFTHFIGTSTGRVGLRGMCAPMYFETFSVTSPIIAVDTNKLERKLDELENFDFSRYTENSADALRSAIAEAKRICELADSQADVDEAYSDVVAAQAGLLKKATKEQLSELVARADETIASGEYTKNTVSSLRVVLREIDGIEGEQAIAYWCNILSHKLDNAVKYAVKDGENNE